MGEVAPRTGSTTSVAEGVEVRKGTKADSIRIQFVWRGKRRRETLKIPATSQNIKYAIRLRGEVMNAIARGTFDYAATFPDSKVGKHAASVAKSNEAKRIRAGALFDAHLKTLRASARAGAISPSTVSTYAKWIRARLRPKFGNEWLDELTTAGMRQWIIDLVDEGLAGKSIRNVVGIMSSVLGQAEADERIKKNPLAPISLKSLVPKKRKPDEDADPFNSDEIKAILTACDRPAELALFQFLFSTGVRPGEAMALRWSSIDWLHGTVRIVDNVVDAEIGTVEKDTKTSSPRDIPLIPSARDALEAMRPISHARSEYVFLNSSGERWACSQQMRARWVIVVRRSKVRLRTLYQTLHTFASTLLMDGESELLVARLLGHTTVEMVRRTYGRFIPQTGGIKLRSDYAGLGLANLDGTHSKTK